MSGNTPIRRPSLGSMDSSGRSLSSSQQTATSHYATFSNPLPPHPPSGVPMPPGTMNLHPHRLLQMHQQHQQQMMRQQTIQQRQKEMQMEREKKASSPIAKSSTNSKSENNASTAAIAASTAISSSTNKSTPALEPAKAAVLLKQCDWVDKSLWASRQLLGGNAVNVFLRSTSNMQKIRRARIRQQTRSKDKPKADVPTRDVLNARTAKKMKVEMDQGMEFCAILHDTIRTMLHEMDPTLPTVEPLQQTSKKQSLPLSSSSRRHPSVSKASVASTPKTFKSLPVIGKASGRPVASRPLPLHRTKSSTTAPAPAPVDVTKSTNTSNANASTSHGLTLRKQRKKKLPPSGEPPIDLPEFDQGTKKRLYSKKEHTARMAKVLRFRSLRKGDPVAARTSSRDVWILARVVQDYQGPKEMAPFEFLRLTDSRRDQLYRQKVVIQDVEDDTSTPIRVARNLCLPLPRSPYEAAEWCSRYLKKGSRVYAMYPQTTALYTATVVDSTTYCRGDDDIVTVEFDGDEPDETGKIPSCHIPARFVALVPNEFPGAVNKTQRTQPNDEVAAAAALAVAGGGDLNDLPFGDDGVLPGIDDLDFDLFGDT